MLELLSDRTVQWMIGIIVPTLIGIVTLYVTFRVNRRKRSLWYKRWTYPVVEETIDERIQITFDGEIVPDVYVSIISLRYEGTESIVEQDFREPVTFDYGDAKVLDAEIIAKHPAGVNPSVNLRDLNKVVLTPIAMNDGNEVLARILSTGPQKRPQVTGHIVGVKELGDFDKKRDRPIRYLMGTLFAVGVAYIPSIIAAVVIGAEDNSTFVAYLTIAFMIITILMMVFFVFSVLRRFRAWQTDRL